MASGRRANGSVPGFPIPVNSLPFNVRAKLADLLDSGDWRKLGKEMNFGREVIEGLEREMASEEISPTMHLMGQWTRKNVDVTVDHLFFFLGRFEHSDAMMELVDYGKRLG